MALLGSAALAMWWDMAPAMLAEFQDWHTHEHFPERLGVPGFRRATRWLSATGGEGVFVMYEVEAHATLSSPAYVDHLNSPTPWSTKLMPHHRNMVRSQCHVRASRGGGVGRHALTIRLAPVPGCDAGLREALATRIDALASRPGLIGGHLLQHQPPDLAMTTEQKIRSGADRSAAWVFVAIGYELTALQRLADENLAGVLADAELVREQVADVYVLAHSATPPDVT